MFRIIIYVCFLISYIHSFGNFDVKQIRKIPRSFDTPLSISGQCYIIDIDNTICITYEDDFINSIPLYNRIIKLNDLYELGHEINYWSSRGDPKWNEFTIRQLNWWGVKYDTLSVGKPHYDIMFDSRNADILDKDNK